jgi:D-3-phosphoglycerate dehydrogenase
MGRGDEYRSESLFTAVRLNSISYPVIPAEEESLLRCGATVVAIEGQRPEEILQAAEHCDALLVVSSRVPGEVIKRFDRCRIISRLGAGTDRIDVEEATRAGIVVANVPDFCTSEQADHTMALLLAWARRLPYMLSAMRRGEWTARSHEGVHRIAGQTLGLIGFGTSAQAVAYRADSFGLKIKAWVRDPTKYSDVAQGLGVELLSLERLLAESDFVSIHLPLTEQTRGIVNAKRLALMKKTALLINTARGALVEEAALVEALQQRRIGGAALDVFQDIDVFALNGEPVAHPLFELDNVLLTPHCAGSSVESTIESKSRGARHAAEVLAGYWPEHVVNRSVQPKFPLKHYPA